LPEGQGERREGRPARNFRQEIYLQPILYESIRKVKENALHAASMMGV
jgi:hypothetical protein